MTKYLPPNLLTLFEARPPIEFLPPPEGRKMPGYTGIASLMSKFNDALKGEPSPVAEVNTGIVPTIEEIRAHKRKRRLEEENLKITKMTSLWDPKSNANATSNAYKTLFVGRLAHSVTEAALKREFENFGKIVSVVIVKDKEGKSRGYGFVEFEDEKDMQIAYEKMDGVRIDERKIVVDVERGRTVSTWKPRRLGGGLGSTRLGADSVNVKSAGRFRAESRGGPEPYRGGFEGRRDDYGGDRYRGGFDRRRDDYGGDRYRGSDRDYRDHRDRDRDYRDHRDRDRDRRDFDRRRDDRYREERRRDDEDRYRR